MMNNSTKVWIGIGVFVLLVALWFGSSYNSLVGLDESVTKSWANVETDYQRRFDLIPNVISTVKGYAAHEENLFTEITKLRSQWASQPSVNTAQQLEGALGKLLLVAENYPQLKASENFLNLQAQLEGTENRISTSRKDYNGAVQNYNIKVRRFPTNLVAKIFSFGLKTPFEAELGTEKAPKVEF